AGDPETVTYIRSACKPIQALNVFMSGAQDKYNFSSKELDSMCASQYGEDMHRDVILGILDKLGLSLDNLLCGTPLSIQADLMEKQLRENRKLEPYNSDCSGKHCGFLAACLASGYPVENYNDPNHPMEKDVLKIVSEVTDVPEDSIAIGIDGCGVPVHGLPLKNMAMGYARMTSPENLPEKYRAGAERIFTAMNEAPEMVAGTGGFCTELLKHTHGKLIGKLGAEAVYCVGIKDRDIGIAIKVDDGEYHRPLFPTVLRVLEQLDLITEEELAALEPFRNPPVINDLGWEVGVTRSVVELEYI
ncbi:MAG: asparaginase, partial [Firmicutes bacterium]|nr:asparaginase [Bacillota bacterium]